MPSHAARAVIENGWTILEHVIPAGQVSLLTERIDAVNEALATPLGANEFLGERTRRLFNLLPRDDAFAEVPLAAPVLPVIDAVIGEDCLLSSITAVEMNPGQTAQPFHADDGSLPLPRPHAPLTCTAIWALTDFTLENGATRLVPDSHRSERIPHRGETPAFVQAEMPAGSVLVYHGSLWHGGGANQSAARRLGVIVNYCAGFLRQEECQLLAVPKEQASGYPPRLQSLLGYSTYRGLLGHVEQKSPRVQLDPDAPSDMVWDRMRSS